MGHFSECRYFLGECSNELTLILLQTCRDANGSRIVIQIGGVYTTFCQKEGIFSIEMGGVSQCFSKVSGSGVDLTFLIRTLTSNSSDLWIGHFSGKKRAHKLKK